MRTALLHFFFNVVKITDIWLDLLELFEKVTAVSTGVLATCSLRCSHSSQFTIHLYDKDA